MLPKTRPAEELVISSVGNDLVIYDRQHEQAHTLNPTAAFVFKHLDEPTSPTALSMLLAAEYNLTEAQANDLMWLSLDRLEKAHLLQEKVMQPQQFSRRQVLQIIGKTAVLLPIVTTIVAHPPEAHASQGGGGGGGVPWRPGKPLKPPKPPKPKKPKKHRN